MIDAKEIPLTDLPDSLRELTDLIGLPAAMILTERWGGVCLNIPVKMRPDHPLALYLGLEPARKLWLLRRGSDRRAARPRNSSAFKPAKIRLKPPQISGLLPRYTGRGSEVLWVSP